MCTLTAIQKIKALRERYHVRQEYGTKAIGLGELNRDLLQLVAELETILPTVVKVVKDCDTCKHSFSQDGTPCRFPCAEFPPDEYPDWEGF